MKDGYKLIHKQFYGSRIYGTQVPTSDMDIKGVVLPTAADICTLKVTNVWNKSSKKDPTGKNGAGDEDEEYFTLHEFIKHLLNGQTVALDMIFTPESMWLSGKDDNINRVVWEELVANRHRFLHSGVAAFAGYARSQANKYGIRGSRLNTAEAAIRLLKTACSVRGPHEPLGAFWSSQIEGFVAAHPEHSKIVTIPDANKKPLRHWEVCNRKVSETASVKYALDIFEHVVEQYGERSKSAASQNGADLKAYYHAVRVSEEAVELLTTGKITLPRPNADFLLSIRRGEISNEDLAALVDTKLTEVNEAMAISTLPKEPDFAFANEFIRSTYEKIVRGEL